MIFRICIVGILICLITPAIYIFQNINVLFQSSYIDSRLIELTINSITCALCTSFFALVIAIPLAFFFCHYHFVFKKLLFTIFCLPLIIPSYILAYGYQSLVEPLGFELSGFSGTIFVLTLANYPLAFLFIANSLHQYDNQLDESAAILGCNKFQIFYKITFWQMLPAILSSGLIISLYTLSDFGTPALMNFPTLTREIKIYYDLALLNKANVLTILLIFIAFIFIFLSEKTKKKRESYSNNSIKNNFYQAHKLKGINCLFFLIIFCLLSFFDIPTFSRNICMVFSRNRKQTIIFYNY